MLTQAPRQAAPAHETKAVLWGRVHGPRGHFSPPDAARPQHLLQDYDKNQ